MANKSKNTKNIIIGICAAVVVVALIVVAIVLGTRKGGFGGLNDSYFVSDDSKLVLDMGAEADLFEEEEYPPISVRLVYTYSDDKITGLSAYYEYADEETAKAAHDYFANNTQGEFKSITRDGVYVIMEADESEYENVTVSDVKQQIEFIEMIKNMNINESSDEESNIEDIETTVEPEEAEDVEVDVEIEE